MKKILLSPIAVLVTVLALCSSLIACKEQPKVSFETLEAQRQTAIDNSSFNATIYRNNYNPDLKIKARGDSSIKDTCPQGDGWATIDLIDNSGNKVVELKCSTVSSTIACSTTEDFQKRFTDGRCDETLPMPLPKAFK